MADDVRPLVVIGGGGGFVGQALARALGGRFRVAGISRGERTARPPFDEWRRADLFNLREAKVAVAGARYAVYLVHSMLPSASLTQGSFEDMDLICADNFARAAQDAGAQQIVYLGGLVPDSAVLSPHLRSRLEVEKTLASRGVPVTTLRAGLVIGGGGSSFEILVKLVRRLPAMICPRWTLTRMQPVAVDDVAKLLAFAVGRPECYGQTFDVGAPEALTYRELMAMCAELLGLRRRLLPIRLMTPWLSKLWVQLVSGAPGQLVGPLVESLRHEMVARDLRLARLAGMEPTSVRDALVKALRPAPKAAQRAIAGPRAARPRPPPQLARSVQRMTLPPGLDAAFAAAEYERWLPRALHGLVRAQLEPSGTLSCRFVVPVVRQPLLVLTHADPSGPDRQLFYVTGGLLARPGQHGRFELRQVLDGRTLLTAVHDFGPRLPFALYRVTQAVFHSWVMRSFGRHLLSLGRAAGREPAPVSS